MIKNIVYAVTSLAGLGQGLFIKDPLSKFLTEKVLPPTDGKFFYTDMRAGGTDVAFDIHGTHRVDTIISNGMPVFDLAINSEDPYFTVISNTCNLDTCDVSQKYFRENSKTYNNTGTSLGFNGFVFSPANESLGEINFAARGTSEQVKMQLHYGDDINGANQGREVTFNITMAEVMGADMKFNSDYDGFIGIQPYQNTENGEKQEDNFMYQLIQQGYITHQIVMINAANSHGNSSVVKWGSWDQSAIASGSTLELQQTLGANWTLQASNFFLNGIQYLTTVGKQIHLDPHLPYLYMPLAEFTHFAIELEKLYSTISTWSSEGCSVSGNYCRFSGSCAAVKTAIGDMQFSIELNDGVSQFNLTTKEAGMLVDGGSFGHTVDQFCYIPVFVSKLKVDNQWYVGSLFMSQYVVVYDNTPFQLNGQPYAQVGFGMVNPTGMRDGINSQYNKTFSGYAPSAQDSSHIINATKPAPPKPPTPPAPTPPSPTPPGPDPNPTPVKDNSLFIYLGICAGLLVLCLIVSCCVANKRQKKQTFRMFSDTGGGMKPRIQ